MNLFSSTATYYSRYRPGIPDEVATRILAEAKRSGPATTLLDLGTGTGQVIEALHRNFADIIGVDPDSEMLTIAEQNLRPLILSGTKLRLYNSKAEEFQPPSGWSASLVTICRAFHWMDQVTVLNQVAKYMPLTGTIAVFGDRSFWEADNQWKQAVRRVIQDFLGDQRRAGGTLFSHHNRPYTEILKESPFRNVTEYAIAVHRTWSTESIIGYLYSTSFAARPLFGDRVDEFEAAVRAVLLEYSNRDSFDEENEFVIRIGRRG